MNKPRYDLMNIKQAFCTIDKLNMTFTAMQGQYELELSDQDVVDAIQGLCEEDFYKSMPPKHKNYSAWHDVYKSTFNEIDLYIKFQVDKRGEMIVSFKRA